jgi:hypothetical protein
MQLSTAQVGLLRDLALRSNGQMVSYKSAPAGSDELEEAGFLETCTFNVSEVVTVITQAGRKALKEAEARDRLSGDDGDE